MKKKLMIGGGMAVLLALIWVGAKNLSATAETDVSAGEKTKQYAVDTKVKKDASDDAEETDQVKRTSPSEDSEEDNAESADGAKKQAASSGTVKAIRRIRHLRHWKHPKVIRQKPYLWRQRSPHRREMFCTVSVRLPGVISVWYRL